MSKYIDVAEGDVFGADASLCQMRGSMFRNFEVGGVTGWLKSGKHTDNTALRPVSRKDAELMIRMAGYTIIPAKTEPVICSSCRTFGCDDHVPDAKPEPTPGVFHLKCPQCCFVCKPDGGWVRRMCGCKHEDALVRVDGPLVLPERKPTPDVPVVDAVWVVEQSLAGPNKRLTAYPTIEDASKATIGKPYIVRLAPDAALAATVKRVEERVNDLTKIVHGLQDSMPGYDKDVTADEAFRRLDERLSKLEATTIRLDRPMEFGQGPATAICLAALRAVGVHDEEVNRE